MFNFDPIHNMYTRYDGTLVVGHPVHDVKKDQGRDIELYFRLDGLFKTRSSLAPPINHH